MALSEFTGSRGVVHQMVSARTFYEVGGQIKPGRNGISLKVELLPAVVKGLVKAMGEARAAGLLPSGEREPE